MTPQEIVQVILRNIEATRAVMEDGPTGYVLQLPDRQQLICQSKGTLRQDNPLMDDVAVIKTHAQAVTMQRFWNHDHPDDRVKIKLRREALVEYIDAQQQTIHMLAELVERANKEQ